MENNKISLADALKPAVPENMTAFKDENGIFSVEQTENGCCLRIKSTENCAPYIIGAIAKYAESHSNFNTELVSFGEPEDAETNKKKAAEREEFDKNFTLIATDSGSKMIWNKAENNAFAFSFKKNNPKEDSTVVNVMEMKYCKRISPCVYAFCLGDDSCNAGIGLVDVQTGTIVAPEFLDIWSLNNYSSDYIYRFVGIFSVSDEKKSNPNSDFFGEEFKGSDSDIEVGFKGIDTKTGIEIYSDENAEKHEENRVTIFYNTIRCTYKEDALRDREYKAPNSLSIDIFDKHHKCGDEYVSDGRIYLEKIAGDIFDNKIFTLLAVDCRNIFVNKAAVIYLCNRFDYIKWTPDYYLHGDKYDDIVLLGDSDNEFPMMGVEKDGMWAIACPSDMGKHFITGFDFTSQPYRVFFDNDPDIYLIIIEIYGKKGVFRWANGTLKFILPIEFDSINPVHKGDVFYITDSISGVKQTYISYNDGFAAYRMGMCAIFDLDGARKMPFVRAENLCQKEEKQEEEEFEFSIPFPDDETGDNDEDKVDDCWWDNV